MNIFDYIKDERYNKEFADLYKKSATFRRAADSLLRRSGHLSGKNNLVSIKVNSQGQAYFELRKGEAVTTFTNLGDLQGELAKPLSMVRSYTGRQAGSKIFQPSLGGYHNSFFESLAEQLGGKIVHKSYNTTEKNSHAAVLNEIKSGGSAALPVVDNDIIHTFEFIPNGKNEAVPMQEFLERMNKHFGFGFDPTNASLMKRLKAMTSPRLYSITATAAETRMRVGTFSPTLLGQIRLGEEGLASLKSKVAGNLGAYGASSVDEAIKKIFKTSFDGQSFTSASNLLRFEKELTGRIKSLEKISKVSTEDKALIQNELKALKDGVEELRRVRNEGGSFNQRFIANIFGKGDVNVLPDEDYARLAGELGYDSSKKLPSILIGSDQVKPELRMTKATLETLEKRNKAMPLEMGITEAATFPDVISPEFIRSNFKFETNKIIEDFQSGKPSEGLQRMIREALKTPEELGLTDPQDIEDLFRLQKYAKSIQSSMEYGIAPSMVDTQAIKFISAYKKHFSKFREGKGSRIGSATGLPDMAFRTLVKGGSMAEISSNSSLFFARRKQTPMELMDGVIRYDQRVGRFGFTDLDFTQIYKAGGGPDSDDTYRAMLFYDQEAKKMMAFMTRQPFEMGEYMWMEADMTSMPMFGIDAGVQREIRRLERQRAAILRNTSRDAQKLLDEIESPIVSVSKSARRRAARSQNRLFNINRRLEDIYSTNFEGVNLSEKFSSTREFMAPKGHEVTAESIARYRSKNIFRSYASPDSSEGVFEYLRRFISDSGTMSSTGSIFDFRGQDFNLVDERYYQLVSGEDQFKKLITERGGTISKEADGIAQLMKYKLDAGFFMDKAAERAEILNYSKGFLGDWVNVKTTIDQLIETQMRGKTFSTTFNRIKAIEREQIIDAAVKSGDYTILEAARILTEDAVRDITKFIANEKIANPDLDFGLSAFMNDTRLIKFDSVIKKALDEVNLELEKQGKAPLGVRDILNFNDPMTLAIEERLAGITELDKTMTDIARTQSIGLEGALDEVIPTAKEVQTAREFLDDYMMNYQELMRTDPESIIDRAIAGEEFIDELFYGEEELNRRSIAFLQEKGLLQAGQESQLQRQILTTAKMLEQNRGVYEGRVGPSLMAPLTTVSTNPQLGLGMDQLFYSSMFEVQNKELIQEYNRLQGYLQNSGSDKASMSRIEERIARAEARIEEIKQMLPEGVMDRRTANIVRTSEGVRGERFTRVVRETVDAVAESQTVRQITMKRFSMEGFRKVVNETKGAKGTLMVLGMVAALGALHGDRSLDRTPEDMTGPPLLPGGSAYEDYSDIQDFSSMYSVAPGGSMNPGMLYRVNVNGGINPTELQSRIQSITGGSMASTIYNSRETVRTGRQDSSSILYDRLGFS